MFQTQSEPSTFAREIEVDGVDSDSSKSGKQSKGERDQEHPTRILKRRRTNNSEGTDSEPTAKLEKLEKPHEGEESEENKSIASSLFGSLIKVAAAMNPKQFELPSELVEPIIFPGISLILSCHPFIMVY